LIAVTIALPFLGIRLLYTCITAFQTNTDPLSGSLALRVIFETLMEFLIVIDFTVFGIYTRNVKSESQSARTEQWTEQETGQWRTDEAEGIRLHRGTASLHGDNTSNT
jgi:hypothetical protein